MNHNRILYYYNWEQNGDVAYIGAPDRLMQKIMRHGKTKSVTDLSSAGDTSKAFDCIGLYTLPKDKPNDALLSIYERLNPGGMLVIKTDLITPDLWTSMTADQGWHPCQFGDHTAVFKENDLLAPYKDKHKGERVYIIGNGPSLKQTDLDLIKDAPAIAMNRINLLYPHTKWRPRYYIYCSDNVDNPRWGKDWTSSVAEIARDPKTTSFVWTKYAHAVPDDTNPVWLKRFTEEDVTRPHNFSDNAAQWMSKSGTSINVALQLAHYMGFKQIVFLGIDLNWQTSDSVAGDPNHFDTSYQANIADGEEERRRMLLTHYNAKMALKKHGVEIYNATPESFVDTYPFVRFETIAKDKKYSRPYHDEDHADCHRLRDMVSTYWRRNGLLEQRRMKFNLLDYLYQASIVKVKQVLGPVKRALRK